MARLTLRSRPSRSRTTGLSWPPQSVKWGPRRVRPERRGRGDVIVAAVLVLALVTAALVLWQHSSIVGTTDKVAARPMKAAPAAAGVPAGFAQAWTAPSAATTAPVVAGPAVVTADGSTVSGRDAATGIEAWSYTRDRPLCTSAAGFPASDGRRGQVLALFEGVTGFCSEMTTLRPDTGARIAARNSDVVPGTELIADDTFVAATGEKYLEVERSDLVKTLEYGAVIAPAQPDQQPRVGCNYGSVALDDRRLGVIERCPDEATDRLTVLAPDPADAEKPEEEFSVLLPSAAATVVALTTERVAVALTDPPRLEVLDRSGAQITTVNLDVPPADLAVDPPGGVAEVQVGAGGFVSWWTGSRTVALDPAELTPRWTIPDTLGPALSYGGGLLVPVPAGLLDVEVDSGKVQRTIPVDRGGAAPSVRLAAAGAMVLEQRGTALVALRPAP